MVCVIAFTIEYFARLATVPSSTDNEGWFACKENDAEGEEKDAEGLKAEFLARVRFILRPFNLVCLLELMRGCMRREK